MKTTGRNNQMKTLLMTTALVLLQGFSASAFSKAASVETPDETIEAPGADIDRSPDSEACLTPDRSESDPSWSLFERAIPACKRAVVTLNTGARLDLGKPIVSKELRTGMVIFKAKVISGQGVYDIDNNVRSVDGVTIWISMDRCDLRNSLYEDDDGGDAASFEKARFLITQEDVSGIAHGDELPSFQDDCKK